TVTKEQYNHYTLLRSVEDLFGLSHLGYAGLSGERSLGSDVFNRACALRAPVAHIRVARSKGRMRVRWSATGAPAASFVLQVRQTRPRLHPWKTLRTPTSAG